MNVWPSPAAQPKATCVKAEIHVMWRLWWPYICRSESHLTNFLFTPFSVFFPFLEKRWSFVLKSKERGTFKLAPLQTVPFFCSLSNSIYGLSEISNAWETSTSRLHLLLLPAPSQSHFLNGLSSGMSPSPVLCQAGRVVLWGQTKGWLSLRPVSLSPNRHHGSVGRRYQTWFGSNRISHTGWQAVRKTIADRLNRTEPQNYLHTHAEGTLRTSLLAMREGCISLPTRK